MPPAQPQRDQHGRVIPHDHADITADDDLIRRISEEQLVTKGGVRRISSLAFQASGGPGGGMSIDIPKSIAAVGIDPKTFVTTPRWFGSVVFKAGVPRAHGLMGGLDPLPDNPPHGEVWGSFTKGKSKAIQRECSWFVEIDCVSAT